MVLNVTYRCGAVDGFIGEDRSYEWVSGYGAVNRSNETTFNGLIHSRKIGVYRLPV